MSVLKVNVPVAGLFVGIVLLTLLILLLLPTLQPSVSQNSSQMTVSKTTEENGFVVNVNPYSEPGCYETFLNNGTVVPIPCTIGYPAVQPPP